MFAKTPWIEIEEVEPYTVDQVQRLFRTAHEGRHAARWQIALALGLKQGHAPLEAHRATRNGAGDERRPSTEWI
jgi:hypothetical protein